MADSTEILTELFFKKKRLNDMEKIDDKLRRELPNYSPKANNGGIITVSDSKEVGKRLQSALGFVIGQNTVASQANKAIKTFNIIVSDDLSPDTIVMLKSYLEEKYADTIQLLVSNSIIDLTEFSPDNKEANIALQAVEKLSNVDFNTKQRLARAAMKGELTADEIFKQNSLYQLLRTYNESADYKTGDPILDTLLETSVILPSDKVNDFLTEVYNNRESIIQETGAYKQLLDIDTDKGGGYKDKTENQFDDFDSAGHVDTNNDLKNSVLGNTKTANIYRLFANNDNAKAKVYDIDAQAATKTIADLLGRPENKFIRDRYEKALYLLASHRISGQEFISYSIDRVGIPIEPQVRANILKKFPVERIVLPGGDGFPISRIKKKKGQYVYKDSDNTYKNVGEAISNRLLFTAGDSDKLSGECVAIYDNIVSTPLKRAFQLLAGGVAGAGVAGIGIGTAVALGASTILAPYILIPVLAASGVTGAVIARIIQAHKSKANKRKINNTRRIEGWERVEMLIDQLDENILGSIDKAKKVAFLKSNYLRYDIDVKEEEISKNLKAENDKYDKFIKSLNSVYKEMDTSYVPNIDDLENLYESVKDIKTASPYIISENAIRANYEDLMEALSYKDARDELEYINEARTIVLSNKPNVTVKKIKIPKDGEFMPTFSGLNDVKAYGSVEYDRKMIRDRRYNEPLFMTIRFKERYSDGKFGDNELTAVIGIQGIVNIVPSTEMEEILKNTAGIESEEISISDNSESKSTLDSIFGKFRNTEFGKKLPISGKLFNNLSKLTSLAVANKLAGKDSSPLANTNIIFSQKELDNVKVSNDVDYLKNMKLVSKLMKKYSISDFVVCNDVNERAYICDNFEKVSFDVVPYSALRSKSTADQNLSTLSSLSKMMLK